MTRYNVHRGTTSGFTPSAANRIAQVTSGTSYGSALSFNGANNSVNVPDSNSLDLTAAMTIEAWVRPTTGSGWHTVLLKEQTGDLLYALYSSTNTGRPAANAFIGNADREARGTANLSTTAWSHLAATYDGATLRLYVNGTQVATKAQTGTIATSAQPLKIGGNAVWSERFSGLIDEVRVYSRTLPATEIQTDMTRPVVTP